MGKWVLLMLVGALFVGCEQKTTEAEEKASVVFARIGDHELTPDNLRAVIRVQARMAELRGRPIPAKDFNRWANQTGAMIFPGLVTAEVKELGLRAKGVCPMEVDYAQVFSNYNASCGHCATNFEHLVQQFKGIEGAFKAQFERSALFTAYKRLNPAVDPTPEEMAAYYQVLTNRLEWAKKIDAEAKIKAEKVAQRLVNGEAWEKVAAECSEDKLYDEDNEEFAENWMTVGLDGFGYPELAKALVGMKTGDISKPLETEEGLLIVKVKAVEKTSNGPAYELARILIREAEPVEILSPDGVRDYLRAERSKEKESALIQEFRQRFPVTYPNGDRFTYNLWEEEQP